MLSRITQIVVVIFLICGLLGQAAVFAHFDVTNGSYNFEFHLEPNDAPISGEKSMLYLTQISAPPSFSWEQCECTLVITKDGNTFYATRLTHLRAEYVFPEAGIYLLTVSGKPMQSNAFAPFTISYAYRVTQGKKLSLSWQLYHYYLTLMYEVFHYRP